ncbi:MAG: S-methyl-5'-thioadenosine phosphorylase [Elusimicrobia bacterium]|nr:S-methyl-5'-thioadenosine phosphorylase [Elusimicrobiota bacterium]
MKQPLKNVRLGVIGGSGLYDMPGARVVKEVRVRTPFGTPSDKITIAEISGVAVAFLPRHGVGHRILPTEINSRANIFALKMLGVERVIGVGATGSLKEEIKPKDLVIPDQLVDRTRSRPSTFFGQGLVAHVSFAEPFCPDMRRVLGDGSKRLGIPSHLGGVYVCMEGPAFSTKAESLENCRWGYAVIGMTALPEAKLAREAEMCFATVAFATDYDCWREGEEAVDAFAVIENLKGGAGRARQVIGATVEALTQGEPACSCRRALERAVVTDPKKAAGSKALRRLKLIVGKYFKGR